MRCFLTHTRMAKIKTDKHVTHVELTYFVAGNIRWFKHFGEFSFSFVKS